MELNTKEISSMVKNMGKDYSNLQTVGDIEAIFLKILYKVKECINGQTEKNIM
jgi:hypothetical protein